MSTQLLISMLRKGGNGQEILNILDAITDNAVSENTENNTVQPTLNEIEF